MQYHFKINRETKGFWAQCLELEGCSTQADTMQELQENMVQALNLFLSEPEGSKVLFPEPGRHTGKNIVSVAVDPHVAFAVRLRNIRLKQGLTQKEVAALLGIRGLYTYQRLETPKTSNPEWGTVARIKKVFPSLCLDDLVA